jgi:hypothetical protein
LAAQLFAAEDVLSFEVDFTLCTLTWVQVVHAVEGSQQCGLAAA